MRPDAEWLEADGLGGFASGTVGGLRTRRYHALLLAATAPPTGRFVLVNGLDAWIETPAGRFALSSQRYAPDVVHPDGRRRIADFAPEPWPRWRFRLEDGTSIEHEILVPHGLPAVAVSWRLAEARPEVRLIVRPFLSGRDYHALHHENPLFRFDPDRRADALVWRPYPGVPNVAAFSNGNYTHQPLWYRSFEYAEERSRGLDFTEDLASPGIFSWDLSAGEAALIWSAGAEVPAIEAIRLAERERRGRFASRLHRAADAYVVRRGRGKTILAGYPWFTDWGRDTFVSLRGLCLATGRFDDAREILLEWAGAVSEGMMPNRFPDHGEAPEFNSVDASLWFVVAVQDLLRRTRIEKDEERTLRSTCDAILSAYARGTRFGIRMDGDGLLRSGEAGSQLTWMDARVDGRPVTPRVGKPVEVQALWLRALSEVGGSWNEVLARGRQSLRDRFWNRAGGYLYDVVDVDHEPGKVDASFRPNQIFAVPFLDPAQARRVVETVEARLLTPLGLRSLAPGEPGYVARYEGGPRERDAAYHEGTVWPWLMGPFIEAWLRVRGGADEARREARARFLEPLLAGGEFGCGHLPEIADGEPPHASRGCPFQAWSVGEAIRLDVELGG